MALAILPDDSTIDPAVSCSHCEAVCCRLTVVLDRADAIPEHLISRQIHGIRTMAHASDGWCVALDRETRRCSIYANRPAVCRKFAMGGGYCRLERAKFAQSGLSLRVI